MKSFSIISDKRFSQNHDTYKSMDFGQITSLGSALEAIGKATRDGNAIFLLPQSISKNTYDHLRLASTKVNAMAKNKAVVLQICVNDETLCQIIDYICSGSKQCRNLQSVYETACFYCQNTPNQNLIQ